MTEQEMDTQLAVIFAQHGESWCGSKVKAALAARGLIICASEPVAWLLRTGHGDKVQLQRPECEMPEAWKPLYAPPTRETT